MIAGH